jgi:uncharacterized membrane protein AbrB (regulator of aidB expression)
MRKLAPLIPLGVGTAALGWGLKEAGLPSSYLFAALLVGLAVALRDAYLATTPGGLFAVLAVAFGAGANTTFILAVQGLRLLEMVLLAPLVVRRLSGRRRTPIAASPT